jgi:BirA family biotin operon repressor/biotin-[acetyl-CoA-carboxylase] ligase
MHELEGLSLVIGLAIVEVLQGLNVEAKIKWPNDVFCHGKKMAGVLIEAFNNQEHGSKLIIGIGINVNMSSASQDEITQAWTSVIMETGKVHNRNTLVSAIIRKTQQNLCSFEQTGLASFLPIWQQYDHLYDQEVTLQAGTQLLSGQVKGVNEQGYLLLRLQDGEVRGFSSGEASIKKKV